jgi:hypothetical protein
MVQFSKAPSMLRLEADAGAMEQHLVVQAARPDGPKLS